MTRTFNRLIPTLLAGTALTAPLLASAGELPTGASVVQGTVGIAMTGANALAIQQSSQTAIVNWQTFSIGQGARVDVTQPNAASALLSRVTGSTPSTIAGQLNANGQVYLVNPNGIVITGSGVVRAGAFVGSTLGISDEDFKAGRRVFNLGVLAQQGLVKEEGAALTYFHEATELGDLRGFVPAAILLDEGRGVRKDPAAAAEMLLLGVASDSGDAANQIVSRSASWSVDTIRGLQQRLKRAGYYNGTVDGRGGARMAASLRQWRRVGNLDLR